MGFGGVQFLFLLFLNEIFMMKKLFLGLLTCGFLSSAMAGSPPDEGMWLPLYLKTLNQNNMVARGLQLTADDIYNVNKSSVKDAIVQLGAFCTAEVVSGEGLLFTNHHCAYDAIAASSSTANDYLTNGFWAYKKGEELPTDISASILVRMEDVTGRVRAALDKVPESGRAAEFRKISKEISDEAEKGTHYKANVRSYMNGNQFILSVSEVFKDVRLVGAPPSSIGKFGGDTDNWMWPRHTGDFAVLRIYAGKDNKPADYSTENVPYKPKHVLPINIDGVEKDDYVMIMGYPGRTSRYLTASDIQSRIENLNQSIIDLFGTKMGAMKENMDRSDAVRLQMASTYASGMNTYKYFIGQNTGLKKDDLVGKTQAYEQRLQTWIDSDADRKSQYGTLLADIAKIMEATAPLTRDANYVRLTFLDNAVANRSQIIAPVVSQLKEKKPNMDTIKILAAKAKADLEAYNAEFDEQTDMGIFSAMLSNYFKNMPEDKHPQYFKDLKIKAKHDVTSIIIMNFISDLKANSIVGSNQNVMAFLDKPSAKAVKKDKGLAYMDSIMPMAMASGMKLQAARGDLDKYYRLLTQARMEFERGKSFYPDANSTLRLTYGNVLSYNARDAVKYNHFTTMKGIMEKEDPTSDEFIVPQKLKEIYKAKDFGPYGTDGDVRVAFLSNTDITGGNSGSPVLNSRGELVGIAFDGNWEAMTGDIMFNNEVQRTISVDARYVLLIIDKFAGAKNLIDEMKIVRNPVALPTPPTVPAPAPAVKAPAKR